MSRDKDMMQAIIGVVIALPLFLLAHVCIALHSFFSKVSWALAGKCSQCGGESEPHINGAEYCKVCGYKLVGKK